MEGPSISRIAVLATIAFLACPELSRSAEAQRVNPCEGLPEWSLFVGLPAQEGEPIEVVPADEFVDSIREDRPAIERFIKSLGIDLGIQTLIERLQEIDDWRERLIEGEPPPEAPKEVPSALRGIGGFSTTLLLKKLLGIPHAHGQGLLADPVVYGKIRDYIFLKESNSGHMSVDVCIDQRMFVPLGEDRREFFHWDIEIPSGIYKVWERKDPGNISNPTSYNEPFPGLNFSLPKEAVDPANPRSIWRRGLDHKLHAEGVDIEVRDIYYRTSNDPNLKRLPDGDPGYQSTVESCIDLFTQGSPPATFGELVENAYCLGRCGHPPIFNTGGSGAWKRPDG
jgi:hypothetical protein